MSNKQIVLSGKDLIKILEKHGFYIFKIRGSHHILKYIDGRISTIPVHNNEDLPKGLLRKIIKEDLKMDFETFEKMMTN